MQVVVAKRQRSAQSLSEAIQEGVSCRSAKSSINLDLECDGNVELLTLMDRLRLRQVEDLCKHANMQGKYSLHRCAITTMCRP